MTETNQRPDLTADRRDSKRFPIEQEASYKILDHRATAPESGSGKTLDISSGGVLFETAERLPTGKRVEVSVNWPAQSEGPALKLVAVGRVVRADETSAAMHIEQHEFRTRRTRELPVVEPEKPSRTGISYY